MFFLRKGCTFSCHFIWTNPLHGFGFLPSNLGSCEAFVEVARTQRAAPNDFRPNRMIKVQSAIWWEGGRWSWFIVGSLRYQIHCDTHTNKHSLYQRNMDLLWTIANMMHVCTSSWTFLGFPFQPCIFVSKGEVVMTIRKLGSFVVSRGWKAEIGCMKVRHLWFVQPSLNIGFELGLVEHGSISVHIQLFVCSENIFAKHTTWHFAWLPDYHANNGWRQRAEKSRRISCEIQIGTRCTAVRNPQVNTQRILDINLEVADIFQSAKSKYSQTIL